MFKVQLTYTEKLFNTNKQLPKIINLNNYDKIEDILLYFFIYFDVIVFTDDHSVSTPLIDAKKIQDSNTIDNNNIKYHQNLIQDIIKNSMYTINEKDFSYQAATEEDIKDLFISYSNINNNNNYNKLATSKDTIDVFKSYYEKEIDNNIKHYDDTLINPAFEYPIKHKHYFKYENTDILTIKLRHANMNDILKTTVMKYVPEIINNI